MQSVFSFSISMLEYHTLIHVHCLVIISSHIDLPHVFWDKKACNSKSPSNLNLACLEVKSYKRYILTKYQMVHSLTSYIEFNMSPYQPSVGRLRSTPGVSSQTLAMRRSNSSFHHSAISCKPTGKPRASNPAGTCTAGMPMRFAKKPYRMASDVMGLLVIP